MNARFTEVVKDRAFLFSVAALAIILSLAFWDWGEFKAANMRVRETDRALRQIELILSTAKDAETGQRGFLITGDERYLEPYKMAQLNILQIRIPGSRWCEDRA